MQTALPTDSSTAREWTRVWHLAENVRRENMPRPKPLKTFALRLDDWDAAVRQFREVEQRLLLGQPDELTWDFHAIVLHTLLAAGHALLAEVRQVGPAELAAGHVTLEEIEACVAELEQTNREWRHGLSEDELAAVRAKIFDGAA